MEKLTSEQVLQVENSVFQQKDEGRGYDINYNRILNDKGEKGGKLAAQTVFRDSYEIK